MFGCVGFRVPAADLKRLLVVLHRALPVAALLLEKASRGWL